jgi:hypothetical protein
VVRHTNGRSRRTDNQEPGCRARIESSLLSPHLGSMRVPSRSNRTAVNGMPDIFARLDFAIEHFLRFGTDFHSLQRSGVLLLRLPTSIELICREMASVFREFSRLGRSPILRTPVTKSHAALTETPTADSPLFANAAREFRKARGQPIGVLYAGPMCAGRRRKVCRSEALFDERRPVFVDGRKSRKRVRQ